MSEKEFRQSGAEYAGVTINVAFLQEIKSDFGFRDLLNRTYQRLSPDNLSSGMSGPDSVSARQAAEMLIELRDELKTYFALEEFYGYFQKSAIDNPSVSLQAMDLQDEHTKLFVQLGQIVERAEKIVYQEPGSESLNEVALELESFCIDLASHEQSEMDLMMRLCNEDIGVGD
jgi:hypothetical protein